MKCPICRKRFDKKMFLIEHLEKVHPNELPDNMTAAQFIYYSKNGTLNGICMCGCGRPTEWNDKTGLPYKVRNDPDCKATLRERAVKNGADGSLLKDMNHQRFMQSNKKNGGIYKFKDGAEINYLSSNEKIFLNFCEEILELTGRNVFAAWQVFEYMDKGVVRKYMPDFYLPDYNLIIEIKASNTNPEYLKETGYKVKLKDDVMKAQKEYNFIKITDNNYKKLMVLLFDIVHNDKLMTNTHIITENNMMTQHEGLYVGIIKSSVLGIMTNIAISGDSTLNEVYLSSLSGIKYTTINNVVDNDNDKLIDVYKYTGNNPDTANKVINSIANKSIQNSKKESSIMAILDSFDTGKIKYNFGGKLYNDRTKSDFVKLGTYRSKEE